MPITKSMVNQVAQPLSNYQTFTSHSAPIDIAVFYLSHTVTDPHDQALPMQITPGISYTMRTHAPAVPLVEFVNATAWAVAVTDSEIQCAGANITEAQVRQVAEWYAARLSSTDLFLAHARQCIRDGYAVIARPLRPIDLAQALIRYGRLRN